jgi:hypothetical protein
MNSNRPPTPLSFAACPPPEYRGSVTWIFSCETEGKGGRMRRKGREQQSQAQDFSRIRDHGNIVLEWWDIIHLLYLLYCLLYLYYTYYT